MPKRWEALSCSDFEFVEWDVGIGDVGGVDCRRGKEGWTFQTFEKQKSDHVTILRNTPDRF